MSNPASGISRRSHPKSRNGCQRCKLRKVKCDESLPSCKACVRHDVTCVYSKKLDGKQSDASLNGEAGRKDDFPSNLQNLEYPNQLLSRNLTRNAVSLPSTQERFTCPRNTLELRLQYQFLIHTCHTVTPSAHEIWAVTAPPLAFQHDFLMNGMLAVAALHLEKTDTRERDMARLADEFFQRTLEGQQEAINNISEANVEATFLTSALVSMYTLSVLDKPMKYPSVEPDSGYLRWLRVGRGARAVYQQGREWLERNDNPIGVLMNREPDLSNQELNYSPSNRDDLQHLLHWGIEYESISPVDREAYEKTLSFVGSIYKALNGQHETALMIGRRLNACPNIFPSRFIDLAQERRPRALAILAYLFASMKLIKVNMWWLRGIAETQVYIIEGLLPSAWKAAIEFPLRVIQEPIK